MGGNVHTGRYCGAADVPEPVHIAEVFRYKPLGCKAKVSVDCFHEGKSCPFDCWAPVWAGWYWQALSFSFIFQHEIIKASPRLGRDGDRCAGKSWFALPPDLPVAVCSRAAGFSCSVTCVSWFLAFQTCLLQTIKRLFLVESWWQPLGHSFSCISHVSLGKKQR